MKQVNGGKEIQCEPINESQLTDNRVIETEGAVSCSKDLKVKRIFRHGMPESERYIDGSLTEDNNDFLTLTYNNNPDFPNSVIEENLTIPINFDDYCVSTLNIRQIIH